MEGAQHSCPNSTPAYMNDFVSQNEMHASTVMAEVSVNVAAPSVRAPGLSLGRCLSNNIVYETRETYV
jgi:hypothetical protein